MADLGKLPPLNALRGFDAVARHLSFGRAADELNVTPAAVSQQIKVLEDFLGVKLFIRQGRQIHLSEAGRQLLPGIEKGFSSIADAVHQFVAPKSASHITCSTVGAFAVRWLVPRLSGWIDKHPDTDIRISTTGEVVEFERNGIDTAIRLGTGDWQGLRADLLFPEQVIPLCSPELIRRNPGLNVPGDLLHHQLIHFTPPFGGLNTKWEDWFKIAGVDGIETTRGMFFNEATVALNAAVRGQGVVLAPRSLATDDLSAGSLVSPFDIPLETDFAWYIVMPENNLSRPEVATFREWLLTEASVTHQ